MSFDLAWLDLREPADHAARDPGLLAAARAHAAGGIVVDLGAGTGSTLRAFGADAGLAWRLVDHDPALLAAARSRHGVDTHQADLTDLAGLPLAGAVLVTASALCDLVSRDWLEALADRLAEEVTGLYAALNYDGRTAWQPPLPDDHSVTTAFNEHQRRDKGFGPALGPDAPQAIAEIFGARGFRVATAESPWRLGPAEAALQAAFTDGIAQAAHEMGVACALAWAQARRAASGSTSSTVGHTDLLALPARPNAQSKTTSVPSP